MGFVPSDHPVACSADKPCTGGLSCRYDVPGAEQCDQGAGNGKADSGCSAKCLALGANSVTPATTCGNGDLAFNEQCDVASGSGCSLECLDTGSAAGISVCGNGKVTPGDGKDCDLGNQNGKPGASCTSDCRNAGTPVCSKQTDANCCGNTTVDPGEDPGCDQEGLDQVTKQPKLTEGCDLSCRKLGSSMN
jgi:hypothetical protein